MQEKILSRKVGDVLDAVIEMTGHKDFKLADHYRVIENFKFQFYKRLSKVRKFLPEIPEWFEIALKAQTS